MVDSLTESPCGASPPWRVIFIASDYPPLAGTNTQRIQSFVRHLPRFGWMPSVVTRAVEDLPLIDPAELTWPEATREVYRVTDPDPFAWLARRGGHGPRRVEELPSPTALEASTSGHSRPKATVRSWSKIAASRLAKSVLRLLAYYPDPLRLWSDAAASFVMRGGTGSRPDVIVTSHPAYSTHLAGLRIKKRLGVAWVADFRDLWVGRPYRPKLSKLHTMIDARQEEAVIRTCDRLVLASPAWLQVLEKRYGAWVARKTVIITNGFEGPSAEIETDSLSAGAARPPKRFVYTGSLHAPESPVPFLRALVRTKKDKPHLLDGVVISLIGNAGGNKKAILEAIAHGALEKHVMLSGAQPHFTCRSLQRQADVLLLFQGSKHADTIQGKCLEYLGTGKPVLALIPSGGIQSAILRRAGVATIASIDDDEEIVRVVQEVLEHGVISYCPKWNYINQFQRDALAGRFAEVLADALCVRNDTVVGS